jgi:uncharacterized membrane protein
MKAYNDFAGRSLDRIAALSDGIFAFAMTLLVLDLHVPDVTAIHSEPGLLQALLAFGPRLLAALMTFLTLGIFWVGQQTLLAGYERSDRSAAWLHLMFLIPVVLMPFSTALLAEFMGYRIAVLEYWLNIFSLGACIYANYSYALRAGLMSKEGIDTWPGARRRILAGQSLYALGALLCIFGTPYAVAFIFLVQLNYAIAPRIPGLYKL